MQTTKPLPELEFDSRFADGVYSFEIRSTDVDFSDQLQLPTLFAFLQEAAYRHAEQLGIGSGCLDALDLSWVLTKISLRLDRLPVWGEVVQVRTWSRGAQKLIFARDFELSAGSDLDSLQPFARASSEWLVIRRDNHRPQRPEIVLTAAGLPSERPGVQRILPEDCPKISPPENGKIILNKQADFSEIDRNRHLNNTRYIAWAMDALYAQQVGDLANLCKPDMKAMDIRSLDINYLSEILPGDLVDLVVGTDVEGMELTARIEGIKSQLGTSSFRCHVQWAFQQTN
ncbi:MAG: thioesterase [Eubacteriales bacterium]|nr:thioesterase [Eubacteriales bacterium]